MNSVKSVHGFFFSNQNQKPKLQIKILLKRRY